MSHNGSGTQVPSTWFQLLSEFLTVLRDLRAVGERIASAIEDQNRTTLSAGGVGFVSRYTAKQGATEQDAALDLTQYADEDLARLDALERAYIKVTGMEPPPEMDLDGWATTGGLKGVPPVRR